jgi:glutamate synthase (NADPH/NADH) small chain
MTLRRAGSLSEPVASRVAHWREFHPAQPLPVIEGDAARCMDCGVPFCQGDSGCPVRNLIPEWNDLVFRGRWREASEALHATNNFPELTGRLCPAPCESACVLGIVDEPVAIRTVEQAIADRGFAEGWIVPRPPAHETGHRVAIVGSGPAGLAAAQQLRRLGHGVTVFEQADRLGGLLRYGIPEFKLEKSVLDRRLAQLAAEGIVFRTGVRVGDDYSADDLRRDFDAVLLATGAQQPRELAVPGRELEGVHLAMDFLTQQNHRVAGDPIEPSAAISARGKHVVIIGGGDTGSDCAGTCIRQGAHSVQQFELLSRPPIERAPTTPWPLWPMKLRTSHAHEEGARREWSVATTLLSGEAGRVRTLHAVRVETRSVGGRMEVTPVAGTELELRADLVLLAMGFSGPEPSLLSAFGVERGIGGMVKTDDAQRSSVEGVFAAGDVRRGASLIVWAIREGRDAAAAIHQHLGATFRPTLTRPCN